VIPQQHVTVRDARVRKRIIRVEVDRLLEEPDALVQILWCAFVPIESPLQIQLISRRILGRPLGAAFFIVGVELQTERVPHLPREVALKRKHVAQLARVLITPQLASVGRVDQLDIDREHIAVRHDVAHEDCAHGQIPSNHAWVDSRVLVPSDRAHRDHPEVGHLR